MAARESSRVNRKYKTKYRAAGRHHFRKRCQELPSSFRAQGKHPRHGRPGDPLGCVMRMNLANASWPERYGLLLSVFLSNGLILSGAPGSSLPGVSSRPPRPSI